jgi:signal transduction histidine kinase
MNVSIKNQKSITLEKLLNEARAEADGLRARMKKLEKVILSTRLIMGHELKKPTTAISGYLDLALDGGSVGSEAAEYIRKARDECDLLNDLNLFFLELLRIDTRREVLHGHEIKLSEFVRDVIAELPSRFRAPERVQVTFGEGTDGFHVNANAFKIILGNIIENALNYSPAGTPVSVSLERSPDKRGMRNRDILKVKVVDQGVGIPKQYLGKIFSPFVRLQEGTTEGSGLGLTLVMSLVELYGGHVYVQSEKGKGASVHVTIPELIDAAVEEDTT